MTAPGLLTTAPRSMQTFPTANFDRQCWSGLSEIIIIINNNDDDDDDDDNRRRGGGGGRNDTH